MIPRSLMYLAYFQVLGEMDLGFRGGFQFLNESHSQNPFNLLFANDIFKQAVDVYETNFEHSVERKVLLILIKVISTAKLKRMLIP